MYIKLQWFLFSWNSSKLQFENIDINTYLLFNENDTFSLINDNAES